MLANPSEFHHSVAGVPTPTATHPTFPPQVPQTGAHNAAVTAATQVGGTPTAGYPAQFVYPQTMYIPQQYHHQFQTAPGPGYITSDGLYTQAAATYVVPDRTLGRVSLVVSRLPSSPSSSSSDHSCTKGTPAAAATPPPTPSPVPSSFPYHNAFPFHHNCIPLSDASPPVMHSYNPLFSYSMANSSVSSLQSHVSCATSVTTMTTTTTTAVIGATGSSVIVKERKRPVSEVLETGILEFKTSLPKDRTIVIQNKLALSLRALRIIHLLMDSNQEMEETVIDS
ncbi:hypothetical protein Avbf_02944 [Armadillidium vulgare]|nr:hypothetical protein Avbf_02944 [Armadillidium vulgare]